MEDGSAASRPKRRCSSRSKQSAAPSAVHYVGYVEEDETPEAIMKKFEELDKVMAAGQTEASTTKPASDTEGEIPEQPEPSYSADHGLTDDQLMEVFKQTSIFNVKSALANNQNLMQNETAEDEQQEFFSDSDISDTEEWDYLRGFWSDEDDTSYGDHWKKLKKLKNKGTHIRQRGGSYAKPRQHIVTHYNAATQALIRRKVKVIDKDALYHVKVPNPLPLSWGRTVKPYEPAADRQLPTATSAAAEANAENVDSSNGQHASTSYQEEEDLLDVDFKKLSQPFQAVLINPGWSGMQSNWSESDPGPRLAALPLPKLCPVGFVFIWAEKEHISIVIKQMYKWGYQYVENLTWVYLDANNTILTTPSDYAQKSHLTLFIFRKEDKGKDIELRHQRNPDVTFDCIQALEGQAKGIPDETFVAIETLLPTGKGKFLELWAARNVQRPGWTHIVEVSIKYKCLPT
ncbi:hypothetical protein ABBQ32_003324 [Trebouxia sp. C0010 RCD-2024]